MHYCIYDWSFSKIIKTRSYIRKIIEYIAFIGQRCIIVSMIGHFIKRIKTRGFIRDIREEPSLVKDVLLYL